MSEWKNPEKDRPPINEEILIIAKTPYTNCIRLLAIFDESIGWYLSDLDEPEFIVRAWMKIPEWEGDNAAGDT